jgi:hypothetical protein
MLIADLPGYGFASASRGEIRAFSSLADRYFQSGRPIRLALVLLDIRHEPSESDRLMMAFLASSGIPFIPVLNKADKLSKAQCAKQLSLSAEMDERQRIPRGTGSGFDPYARRDGGSCRPDRFRDLPGARVDPAQSFLSSDQTGRRMEPAGQSLWGIVLWNLHPPLHPNFVLSRPAGCPVDESEGR